ncbi:MAG: alanine racemase [gamma proteobacterium symbiont of Bathyaustriella thionipta]|nr:alanine racemase [gamma proteobacterium symbiont of Bathyaustriella thionipta]
MPRPPLASIDLAALRHNLAIARQRAGQSALWAVIKADAYGHGMLDVLPALQAADGFAVARLEEAVKLRKADPDKPILLFEPLSSLSDFQQAAALRVQVCCSHIEQIALLQQLSAHAKLQVWLKLDSGMHRLGITPAQLPQARQKLLQCKAVQSLTLMTHFSSADDRNSPATQAQTDCLLSLNHPPFERISLSNSAALLGWPAIGHEQARPGIMLYGASPLIHVSAAALNLQAVMTFSSRLLAVNQLKKGDPVGYGASWVCPQDMPVGVIAAGYADGYPRHAPSGTPVWLNGAKVPLIGRVSMDLISVDLRSQAHAVSGDKVELWGKNLPADEIAQAAETIAYDLFCGVSARVPRVYRDA